MDIKDEHPCKECKYFYGWEEVKVYMVGMCIEIPICTKFSSILAINKCKYFIKGD